jgi:hypothetical protein
MHKENKGKQAVILVPETSEVEFFLLAEQNSHVTKTDLHHFPLKCCWCYTQLARLL